MLLPVSAQQQPRVVPLKRFEVLRFNPDDMRKLPPSVWPLFTDPVPDGRPVPSLAEATKLAGFTPNLLKTPAVSEIVVIGSVDAEIEIHLEELTEALRAAKVEDVSVPKAWDGVVIHLHQDAGVLTAYGDFFIAQAPVLTMTTPPDFPLDQFAEVVFRIAGVAAPEARKLRQDYAASPASFFPIAKRYDMNNHQVRLNSGSALLLQNAEKGGEIALMWSSGDRSYFLSGLLTEAQAIDAANALH
jgi:hypothetical protein